MKKLLFDIKRSLNVNPPKYGTGIKFLERIPVDLRTLVTKDDLGNSLQPREKDHAEEDHGTLKASFEALGVLYDKEVMVVERRGDGKLELQSGYNRLYVLLTLLGYSTYFVDVVEYDNPYFKAVWKRRFNASLTDHLGKGSPNTEGSLLLGLDEAKEKSSFDWRNDDEVIGALHFMANGSKTPKQLQKLLKKWRQTNDPNPNVRGLNSKMANELSEKLELPHKGYCKTLDKPYFDRAGYNTYGGDFSRKIKEWVDLYDHYKVPVEMYGFIQYVVAVRISEQRNFYIEEFDTTTQWMKDHLSEKYHNIVQFKGFHAQIRTPNPNDGGKPTERGIVDVDGKILLDKDPVLGSGLDTE